MIDVSRSQHYTRATDVERIFHELVACTAALLQPRPIQAQENPPAELAIDRVAPIAGRTLQHDLCMAEW